MLSLSLSFASRLVADDLPDTIKKIKPSIVGVGTYQRTRTPAAVFRGTGFSVGDGLHILTNAHVLPDVVDKSKFEMLAVFTRDGEKQSVRRAAEVAIDASHDIALLRIGGPPLVPMRLGDSNKVREGEPYAFTGYPIGMVLGLNPVTHRAIISAISPIAIPAHTSQRLNAKMIQRLTDPYEVFQLDATAYPGNSGSPLYDPKSGEVVGIINKVFVQETKENLLERPSGISYAIPIKYALSLLSANGIKQP
ncbi:S1 family peptidase [Methylocaldum szegediense]|uniref:S1 family peptidase n=1 Tax=Methylocaldum szegediense TaxID=73780 RepID=UPI001F17CA79|nr:serine protease [Methylocaldum szegediense]